MTREEAEALGRRALAAGWDKYSGGQMLCVADGSGWRIREGESPGFSVMVRVWPDFRDAPTHGLLLKLVQECLGLSSWNAVAEDLGDLSPEALVVALENR